MSQITPFFTKADFARLLLALCENLRLFRLAVAATVLLFERRSISGDEAEYLVVQGDYFVLDPSNGNLAQVSRAPCFTSLQADKLSKASIKGLFTKNQYKI
jgi:hypothetical protein